MICESHELSPPPPSAVRIHHHHSASLILKREQTDSNTTLETANSSGSSTIMTNPQQQVLAFEETFASNPFEVYRQEESVGESWNHWNDDDCSSLGMGTTLMNDGEDAASFRIMSQSPRPPMIQSDFSPRAKTPTPPVVHPPNWTEPCAQEGFWDYSNHEEGTIRTTDNSSFGNIPLRVPLPLAPVEENKQKRDEQERVQQQQQQQQQRQQQVPIVMAQQTGSWVADFDHNKINVPNNGNNNNNNQPSPWVASFDQSPPPPPQQQSPPSFHHHHPHHPPPHHPHHHHPPSPHHHASSPHHHPPSPHHHSSSPHHHPHPPHHHHQPFPPPSSSSPYGNQPFQQQQQPVYFHQRPQSQQSQEQEQVDRTSVTPSPLPPQVVKVLNRKNKKKNRKNKKDKEKKEKDNNRVSPTSFSSLCSFANSSAANNATMVSMAASAPPRALTTPLPTSPPCSKLVRFSTVEVRHYERILSDHPAVVAGPSIGIGWRCLRADAPCLLNVYEFHRNLRDGNFLLDQTTRERLLLSWGFKRSDMAHAIRSNNRVKNARRRTVENLRLDDTVERVKKAVFHKSPIRLLQQKLHR